MTCTLAGEGDVVHAHKREQDRVALELDDYSPSEDFIALPERACFAPHRQPAPETAEEVAARLFRPRDWSAAIHDAELDGDYAMARRLRALRPAAFAAAAGAAHACRCCRVQGRPVASADSSYGFRCYLALGRR